MAVLVLIIILAYVILAFIIAAGIKEEWLTPCDEYKVSLIIPARNEAKDLPRSLAAIEKLDYPAGKLEVILVNHASSDSTLKLMLTFQEESQFEVIVVNLKESLDGNSYKSQALTAGVAASSGEVLAFTDAECDFQPGWLKAMAGRLKSGFDMAGGAVLIEGDNVTARLQWMDWLYLCSVGAGFAGLGNPQSLFGKNMLLTRKLYDRAGGFAQGGVWTEDLELVRRCAGKGKIDYTLAPECAVKSLPEESITGFFRQRLRWLKGAGNVGVSGIAVLCVALAADILLIYGFFTGAGTFILMLAARMFGDALILKRAVAAYGGSKRWYYLPLYVLFSAIYHLCLVAAAPFAKNLRWR